MDKDHLLSLMAERGDPCITLHFNVDPLDREGTRIRSKNMVRQVRHILEREHGMEKAQRLSVLVEKLTARMDLEHGSGRVVLVSDGVQETVHTPFTVHDEVSVDRSFRSRQLIRMLGRPWNAHVLVLGGTEAMAFAVSDGTLGAMVQGFPIANELRPRDRLDATMITGELLLREFFNRVDKLLQQATGSSSPIVLACVKEHEALFRSVCDHPSRIIGHVTGDHHRTPPHTLGQAVDRALHDHHERQEARVLSELEHAPVDRYSTDPHAIWLAVREGRGMHLLVEEDLAIPVTLEAQTGTGIADLPVTDDLVDVVIEEHVRHGGTVHFLPTGRLGAYGGIALLTRY